MCSFKYSILQVLLLIGTMVGLINQGFAQEPLIVEAVVLPKSGTAPLTVTMSAIVTNPQPDEVLSYRWVIAQNGTEKAGSTVKEKFNEAGTYNITLLIDKGDVVKHVSQHTVTVYSNQPPIARLNIEPLEIDTGQYVTITAGESFDPDGDPIKGYRFISSKDGLLFPILKNGDPVLDPAEIEDPITPIQEDYWATLSNTTVELEEIDTHTITAIVLDDHGNVSTPTTISVIVGESTKPAAAFPPPTPDHGIPPLAIMLDASKSVDKLDLEGNEGQIDNYSWSITDPNGYTEHHGKLTEPTLEATLLSAGEHKISLTVTDNDGQTGTSSTIFYVTGTEQPIATINTDPFPATGLVGLTVTFNGESSSDPDGLPIENYHWSIGDTSLQNGKNSVFVHTFDEAGTFEIELKVRDKEGLTAYDRQIVTISEEANDPPVAVPMLSKSSGRSPLKIDVDGSNSNDPNSDPLNYQWTSSEGHFSPEETDFFVFNAVGEHTITLTVNDGKELFHTVERTLTVHPALTAPDILATPQSGKPPLTVILETGFYDDVTYEWHSSEGQTDNSRVAMMTFDNSGTYNITLTMTDVHDSAINFEKTVDIVVDELPPPTAVAHVSSSQGSAPLQVTLDGSGSEDADGSIVEYKWVITSGGSENLQFGKYSSLALPTGTHIIQLVVTDNDGLTTFSDLITVVVDPQKPIAKATALTITKGTAPLEVTFDGTGSYDPDGSVTGYSWTANKSSDGGQVFTNAGQQVKMTFSEAGVYLVNLIVTDNSGLESDPSQSVIVEVEERVPPVAITNVSPTEGLAPLTVILNGGGSYDSDGKIMDFKWIIAPVDGPEIYQFGKNAEVELQAAEGEYTITLQVTDDDGLTDSSDGITVTVGPQKPVADAMALSDTTGKAPLNVKFNGEQSYDLDGSVTGYTWTATNESGQVILEPSGQEVTMTFDEPGTYSVELVTTDNDGNQSEPTNPVILIVVEKAPDVIDDPTETDPDQPPEPPVADGTISVTTGVAPLKVILNGENSVGKIIDYEWVISNASSNEVIDIKHGRKVIVLLDPGIYMLRLTVTDKNGLSSETVDIDMVSVEAPPIDRPTAKGTVSPIKGEAPLSITLDATQSEGDIDSYEWIVSKSSIDDDEIVAMVAIEDKRTALITLSDIGLYKITLTVIDRNGSSDTIDVATVNVPTKKYVVVEPDWTPPATWHFPPDWEPGADWTPPEQDWVPPDDWKPSADWNLPSDWTWVPLWFPPASWNFPPDWTPGPSWTLPGQDWIPPNNLADFPEWNLPSGYIPPENPGPAVPSEVEVPEVEPPLVPPVAVITIVSPTGGSTPLTVSGPAPLIVTLNGSSSEGNINTYRWTKADGRFKEGVEVEMPFNEPGVYEVSLKVIDANGLYDLSDSPVIITVDPCETVPCDGGDELTARLEADIYEVTGPAGEKMTLTGAKSGLEESIDSYTWVITSTNLEDENCQNVLPEPLESENGKEVSLDFVEDLPADTECVYEAKLTVADKEGETAEGTLNFILKGPEGPDLILLAKIQIFNADEEPYSEHSEIVEPVTIQLDASESGPKDAITNYEWTFTATDQDNPKCGKIDSAFVEVVSKNLIGNVEAGHTCIYIVELTVSGEGMEPVTDSFGLAITGSDEVQHEEPVNIPEGINLTFKFDGTIPGGLVEFYPGDTFDLSLDVEWDVSDGDCTTVYGLWVAFGVPETVLELLGLKEVIHPKFPFIFLTDSGKGFWFLSSQAQNPVVEILNLEHSFKVGNLLDNPYQETIDIVEFKLDGGIPEGKYPFYAAVVFQNNKGVPCGEPLGISFVEDVYLYE